MSQSAFPLSIELNAQLDVFQRDMNQGVRVAEDSSKKITAAFESSQKRTQVSAAQTAAAMRQLPAQFSDIIVSLQGGQAPLTVLLQQGTQIKDSFGGVGNAAKAIGSYLVGMVNPITVVSVGAGAMALAFLKGQQEAYEFNKQIVLTGNAAGTTSGELASYAKSIAAVVGTQGAASASLVEFASNADVGNASLKDFTLSAILFEKVTGQAVSKTAEQFAALAKAPVEASIKLNEQYNYLTASVYEQIKALTEQGKVTEAADIAQKAFADTISQRATVILQDLGYIERAWNGIWGAIKGAGDAALNFGRGNTLSAQITELESRIKGLSDGSVTMGFKNPKLAQELGAELAALKAMQAGNEANARSAADAAAQNKSLFQWDAAGVKLLPEKLKMERDIAAARQLGLAAGKSSADIAAREKEIRASYAKKTGSSNKGDVTKAVLGYDIDAIRNALELQTAAYANAEQIMEAQRAAGLVSDKDYYAQKIGFLTKNSQAQQDALTAQNQRIGEEVNKGKDLVENAKKAADNETKLALLREKEATGISVLGIQERALGLARANAYQDAQAAASSYLNTIQKQSQRELEGLGQGTLSREKDSRRNQRDDQFQTRRDSLDQDLRRNQITREQYEQYLAIEQDAYTKALAADDKYWAEKLQKQGDWATGASEALRNYADEAADMANQAESAVANGLKGMEDAVVEFAKTGKLNFTSFANSVISDLLRIEARQLVSGAASAAGSVISSFFANAKGGVYDSPSLSAYSNRVYSSPQYFAFAKGAGVFGEAGPEAIMPLTRASNGSLGVRAVGGSGSSDGGGVTVNIIEDASKAGTQQQRSNAGGSGFTLDVFVAQIKGEIASDIAKGSGAIPDSMARTFGLNRAVGAY